MKQVLKILNQVSISVWLAYFTMTWGINKSNIYIFLFTFIIWFVTAVRLDRRWISYGKKYLLLLSLIVFLDYILSCSLNQGGYFRSTLINLILMYSWPLVFIFYSRNIHLVKWPLLIAIVTTVISALYTGIGNSIIPGASRELADQSEYKAELLSEIRSLNIGGYGFIYYVVFLIMPLCLVFRSKVANRLVIGASIIVLSYCLLMASYFTGIVIAFAMILFIFLKDKKLLRLFFKVLCVVALVYIVKTPLLQLLLDFGESIDSAAIVRHATEFLEDKGGDNLRFELFGNAVRNWAESPFWGMLFTGTKTYYSDHSTLLGYFETYGMFGIFCVLLLKEIYDITSRTMKSPVIKNYYILFYSLFLFFLLVNTFSSPIPVSVFFIAPILFNVVDNRLKIIKVLIIAYWYAVENAASGQVQRHFVENLVKRGFSPTVVCASKEGETFTNGVRIIGVPENRVLKFLSKLLFKTWVGKFLRVPDMTRYYWNPKVTREVQKILKDSKFDYIHTINNPSSSHLLGWNIKQEFHLPWVAQFYDPWTNNPTEYVSNKRVRLLNLELEKGVAEGADLILHTNDLMIRYWKDLYGNMVENKVFRLNLLTDVESPIMTFPNDKFIISHIGHFTKYRNSLSFIEAINMIKKEKPHLLNKLKVNYIGLVTDAERDLIKKYGLCDYFELHGRISEKECIPFFEECSMFLIIDTQHNPNVFFPSKILKYFFYRKPILGITSHESVLKDELINSRNIFFEFGEERELAQFLMGELERDRIYSDYDSEYWKKFSSDMVIREYKFLIENNILS